VPDDGLCGCGPVTLGQAEDMVAQNAHGLVGWYIVRAQSASRDQAEYSGDRQTNVPGDRPSSLACDASGLGICVPVATLSFSAAKMVALGPSTCANGSGPDRASALADR